MELITKELLEKEIKTTENAIKLYEETLVIHNIVLNALKSELEKL